MPTDEQGVTAHAYTLIPRTVIFLRRHDSYLLIRGSPTKRLWPGRYNGIGGHLRQGEDVLASARRELLEETGLEADLWLCGTIMVDAGPPGIALFVFSGEPIGGKLSGSPEGTPEWIDVARVGLLPTVEDVPQIIARLRTMQRGDPPFAARSHYDREGRLRIEFAG